MSRFQTGQVYDVGTSVGTYLLAIGSAEPVIDAADVEVGPAEVPAAARKHSNASPPSAVAADRSPEAITGLPDR